MGYVRPTSRHRLASPVRRRSLLASLVVAVVILLLPAGAVAATGQLRGAQTHPLWGDSTVSDFDRELDMLRAAGGDTIRIDIGWSSLESEGKGKFSNWYVEKTDTFLEHAADRGIKVIGTFWATPCWASSAPDSLKQDCKGAWWDNKVHIYPPTDNSDYADAAAWVARRWGSRLAALEIWNEPNLKEKWFLEAPDPARAYAGILKAAYRPIKAAAPDLPVIGGALASSDGEFLKRLYALGAKGSYDGFSIHPYNEWRDPDDPWKPEWKEYTFVTGVPWIHEIMAAHGEGDLGLWLTEFGFSTCQSGISWCIDEKAKAEYIKDSFRIAAGWSYVKAAIVYNLRNNGSNPADLGDQFGLLERDFTPKASYRAFKEAMGASAQTAPSTGEIVILQERIKLTRSGVARVRVGCRGATTPHCVGTLHLALSRRAAGNRRRARSRALGSRRFVIYGKRAGLVSVRLSRRDHRLIAGRQRLRVRATAVGKASARAARAKKSVTLFTPDWTHGRRSSSGQTR